MPVRPETNAAQCGYKAEYLKLCALLVTRIGRGVATLQHWESGRGQPPTDGTLLRVRLVG